MTRLLLADRIKGRLDSFLAPLIPVLERHHDVRFVSLGPGSDLAAAIAWAEIVWLEWCWDHAVWASRSGVLEGRPCVLRLHSIEALQTDYPRRMDWSRIDRLITVGPDITEVLLETCDAARDVERRIVTNGIDTLRFAASETLDPFRIAWVGHLEPKKNPMLMLQIAAALRRVDPRYRIHVAGAPTDLRTARYIQHLMQKLDLGGVVRFDGHVNDMPTWFADKGVLLSTTMYESFGMNIGEAMAVGACPVVHDFPGAAELWPRSSLFASVQDAIDLIRHAEPGPSQRRWIEQHHGLDRQAGAILEILRRIAPTAKKTPPDLRDLHIVAA